MHAFEKKVIDLLKHETKKSVTEILTETIFFLYTTTESCVDPSFAIPPPSIKLLPFRSENIIMCLSRHIRKVNILHSDIPLEKK